MKVIIKKTKIKSNLMESQEEVKVTFSSPAYVPMTDSPVIEPEIEEQKLGGDVSDIINLFTSEELEILKPTLEYLKDPEVYEKTQLVLQSLSNIVLFIL